jgi:hypothetical protein
MSIKWLSAGDHSSVDIQPGGPGNPWIILDVDGMLDGPSGGGRDRETLWGRGDTGLQPRGIQQTSNPHDWTFTASYPLTAKNFLDRNTYCPFTIRARQRCGKLTNLTDYGSPGMLVYAEVTNTDFTYDNPIAVNDGVEADVKRQFAGTASLEIVVTKVAHDDISPKLLSDADINKIISIGFQRCAGDCGVATSEEDQWLAVTDRDSTPGYSGNATARLYYTLDRAVTWNSVPIDPFTLADATDVVFLGDRIVVFSTQKAPAYASFTDIQNGVTAPNLWSTATGFTGITSGNFPKKASAPNSQTIFAVGNGGRFWLSTDGGISFTLLDNGVTTTNNLNAVDFQDDTLGYIGGDSGTLLRYVNGTLSRLPISDSVGTLTANINTVRTPPFRGSEVYAGTAGGEIWRSRNANKTVVTWTRMGIDGTGAGSISDMAFAGYQGQTLLYLQKNAAGLSRVMRDLSGGYIAGQTEQIGNYTTPSNFGYNTIAMANVNFGLTAGDVHDGFAFAGVLRPEV